MNKFLVSTFTFLKKQLQSYLNEEFKDYNLKSSQLLFLYILHNNGSLSQTEISKILECDKAHIHRIVSSLIDKKYIQYDEEKEHSKNLKLTLTSSGHELSLKVDKAMNKWNKFMQNGLNEEELKIAKKVALKVIENAYNFKRMGNKDV